MNPGSEVSGDTIFLVRCTDFKCLAVRDANGKWRNFYDDTVVYDVQEAILAVPYELVLPFLPQTKRQRLSPVRLPVR